MSIKNRYTTKRAIVAALTALIAVLNFMTLLFAITSAKINGHRLFANGFTLAFGECPTMLDSLQNWLYFYCLTHFIISLIFVVAIAARALLKWGKPFGKLGGFSDVMAVLMSLIYMISGIAANSSVKSDYSAFLPKYFSSHTAAFVPFILITVAVVALVLVKWYMPCDFKFNFNSKGKKK